KAIRIYLSARTASGNGELFIEDLALLYAALQQYDLATNEYVQMLRSRPQQLTYVEARMSSYMGRDEARRAALKVVKDEVQRSQNDVSLHSLLAWLFMESKNFDSALVEYRAIDKLSKANGAELFQFAQRAIQERAYRSAAKAFREVIEEYPKQKMIPFARYGYARSIEELSLEADSTFAITGSSAAQQTSVPFRASSEPVSETRPTYQGALGLYESIISDYPNSETYIQSLYRIGFIRFHRFFDLDGAISAFESVRRNPINQNLSLEATASIAEVQTARNDLKQARVEYASLLGVDQYRERVVFRLAELDYFEASFDSALAKVKTLTTNLNTDLANDALQLLYFIQENKTGALPALSEFAKADLLMRQRKYSEALSRFKEVAKTYPTALLQDDALMKIGELYILLNQTDGAIGVFKQLSNDMPTSVLRDRAQMRIGEIYERILRDIPHAIEAYEQVLVKFPTSLYVEEARKRIRLLRGDNI
ncbi:MAG: tetratricopeptide repeat protein, partial [Ignavibacteriales bacterium]|nr:tetratricopeptide repeat protein [Ignavibacteriales bacterium]